MKRQKLSKAASQRDFTKHAVRHHRLNFPEQGKALVSGSVMRGGIRL